LIALRNRQPVLQRRHFFRGDYIWDSTWKDICFYRPDSAEMTLEDWSQPYVRAVSFVLGGDAISSADERGQRIVGDSLLVLLNGHHEPVTFRLPAGKTGPEWQREIDTGDNGNTNGNGSGNGNGTPFSGDYQVAGRAMVVLRQPVAAAEASVSELGAVGPEGVVEFPAPAPRSRRAGVMIPLFSLRNRDGFGVGDISDIAPFAAWAAQAGLSVVQFLPVNETSGGSDSPYAAASAFALDPVYLGLDQCEDFLAIGGLNALSPEDRKEREALVASPLVLWQRVRKLKRAATHLSFQHFLQTDWKKKTARAQDLASFMVEHRAWIDDHALFSVIHEHLGKSWVEWPQRLRDRTPEGIATVRREFGDHLLERAWLQWQLHLQWKTARAEAGGKGVALMGDLPFTVAIDSADVWANPQVFRPDLHVGTPPDAFSKEGQDWGLPAYDWNQLRRTEFAWIRARAARAGVLYSAYRADHVIGLYRTYVRNMRDGQAAFWPPNEAAQISLGETVLRILRTSAEVIAEDLGSVPPFLRPSLDRLAVSGYRVLRWEKEDRDNQKAYRDPQGWPKLSVATNATHDTDMTAEWYEGLSGDERQLLAKVPGLELLAKNARFNDAVRDALLTVLYRSPSKLVMTPFQDLLGHRERINVPGTLSDSNWSYRMPMAIDELTNDSGTIERLSMLAREHARAR
jgi:4-alpha-glucanotransferase